MKYRTTKKAMKENYYYIIGVGYCGVQSLLDFQEPESYCCGVYGWSCDNYRIRECKYNLLISTGYNYISGLKYDYKELDALERKATSILYSDATMEDKKTTINKMLADFCNKVVEDNNK